jgi:tetratricopeptide (TPR) repeat protein
MGVAAYENRKFDVAGLHFDQSARAFHRSASMPRSFPDDIIAAQRADAAVNASMSHLGHAQEAWFANRSDKGAAVESILSAEESIITAMMLRPNHDPTLNAVLFIGETWKDKADVNFVNTDDLADAREFFLRMAERFDVADWWNNYAFWCRETALAAESAGDNDLAKDLFEKSYVAYEKTIELEPDNARYVNDTGLIQLYYLHKDLDRAEKLFYRAWELGKEVCDNPFVDEAVAAENLSAYGDAMLNLAELNRQRGDLEKAKEINDLLLVIAPERPDARRMRRQIEDAM